MSADALLDALPDEPPAEIPAYILNACEAAGEWWATSEQDSRFKFQPSVVLKLLSAIREGLHYEPACAVAGVSYGQFRNWMIAAEDNGPESTHGRFAQAVKVAEAEAELESVKDVRRASRDPRFWAAGMTFLERRHPDRWKRRDDNHLQVSVGVAIGVQASDDQRRTMVPTVIVQSTESLGNMAPVHGLETPSPALGLSSGLSLGAGMVVSDDHAEAKATPIRGVSPASVA